MDWNTRPMRILDLEGTHAEMGAAFGEHCRGEIETFYRLRVANALKQAKQHADRDVTEAQLLDVARACIEPTRAYHPEGWAELEGVARGASISPEQILAMNGLTDLRDVLAWHGDLEAFGGCSSVVVGADASGGHGLCGQTWDLATDNMPYVLVVRRRPNEGPSTRSLTTVGCLSLIGMNDAGIAVGTTNLRTTDPRAGVTYLSTIHRALHSRSLEDATAAVTSAQRAGAHYYYLMDRNSDAVAIECSAEHAEVQPARRGIFVHTNHCLVPRHAEIEANTPAASSHARQGRLEQLMRDRLGDIDASAIESAFADRENGENAINRVDFNGISSNGAVVMEPATGAFRACHGTPHDAEWVDVVKA